MANIQQLKPVNTVQNIINKFCYTIGVIPTCYTLGMTPEEQILAIGRYLEETVIPALNNNAEAVVELQNLYVELKNYVDNYFDNLDVQDEINNKLNQMVEDGTFDDIINNTLFNQLNEKIDNIENKITIMIGDSYGEGTADTTEGKYTSWCDLLAKYLQIDNTNLYFKKAVGSTGFEKQGSTNQVFQNLLEDVASQITDKTLVDKIIVCGGYNDATVDSITSSSLNTAIQNFINYASNTFPNATVYIGMLAYNNNTGESATTIRTRLQNIVLPTYVNSINNNQNKCCYLNGVENVMKDLSLFSTDHIHPNQLGYYKLAKAIFCALKSGGASYCQSVQPMKNLSLDSAVFDEDTSVFEFSKTLYGNLTNVYLHLDLLFNAPIDPITNYLIVSDGTTENGSQSYAIGSSNLRIPCNFIVSTSNNRFLTLIGQIKIQTDGSIGIYFPNAWFQNEEKITRIRVPDNTTICLPTSLF